MSYRPGSPCLAKENDIPVLDSPHDLTPIENLWRDLKHCFYLKFRALFSNPSTFQPSFEKYSTMIQECGYDQIPNRTPTPPRASFMINLVEQR